MDYISLGKTKLLVSKTAFGAECFDCREIEAFGEEADEKVCALVHQAYSGGINFFDTSHSRPVCEKRLGAALHGIRQNVILATKTSSQSPGEIRHDLNESLDALESDYVDLYQIENPLIVPREGGKDGIYNELSAMRDKGLIRHIGLATDSYELAWEAAQTGLYEVIQFPFSMISPESFADLVSYCEKNEVGCIAMQPLNGGILNNIPLAFGFFTQYENVVPVWGARTDAELHQILYLTGNPPVVDEKFSSEVEQLRQFFN